MVLKNRLSKLIVILLYEGVEMQTIKHSCKRTSKFKAICKSLRQYYEMYSLSSSESKYNVIFKLLEDIIQKLNFKEGEIHSMVKNLLNQSTEDS